MALNIADKVRLGCVEGMGYQAIAREKPDIVAAGYVREPLWTVWPRK